MDIQIARDHSFSALNIQLCQNNILNVDFFQSYMLVEPMFLGIILANFDYLLGSKPLHEDILIIEILEHILIKLQCIVILISLQKAIFHSLKKNWRN